MSWLDTLESIRTKDFKKATPRLREKTARDVINLCSYACAVVAVSPIPFSDAVLMLPVQTAMVATIGHIYGRKLNEADAKDLVLELGATFGVGMLARQGIKALLPIVGALLTVPAAFAANWAMGRAAMEYFKKPHSTAEDLKAVFEKAKREGEKLFSKKKLDEHKDVVAAPSKKKAAAKKKKPAPAMKRSPAQQWTEVELPKRLSKNPAVAETFDGDVHLDITGTGGGQWTARLSTPPGTVVKGHVGEPKLKLTVSATDLLSLVKREQDASAALMSGKLKLEPMDLSLAMALGPLFA